MPNLNYPNRPKLSGAPEHIPSLCNSPDAQDVTVRCTCLNHTRPLAVVFGLKVYSRSLDHLLLFLRSKGIFGTHSLHSPILFNARIALICSAFLAPFSVRFPDSGQDPFRAGCGGSAVVACQQPSKSPTLVDDSHRTLPATFTWRILPRQGCISKERRSESEW